MKLICQRWKRDGNLHTIIFVRLSGGTSTVGWKTHWHKQSKMFLKIINVCTPWKVSCDLGHLLLKADLIHQCVCIGFDMKVSCLFSVRQNFKTQNLKKFFYSKSMFMMKFISNVTVNNNHGKIDNLRQDHTKPTKM